MRNPKKNAKIAAIIMGLGAAIAIIGGLTSKSYDLNLCFWIGFGTIVAGIADYLLTVRCPECGHLLAGYRPFPEVCPNCHKQFEK